ncbi:MAG: DUF933 domain-containing protein [Deltaproteobacteria bacterium]|nr:DUF933 domain-containing protein [Deltaproteobacteria bacterium]
MRAEVGAIEQRPVGDLGVAAEIHEAARGNPELTRDPDGREHDGGALIHLVARHEEPRIRVGDHKGDAGCRAAGVFRVEGKDYVVQDGDVLHFRLHV